MISVFNSNYDYVMARTAVRGQGNNGQAFVNFFSPSMHPCFRPSGLDCAVPVSEFERVYNAVHRDYLFSART